jgi:IclR family KDG regulon transcriptional repressor
MKVQSLDRTFDILELLSKEQQGLNLTEISKAVRLHKSTVYRLLSALLQRGYIEKRDAIYKLGLEFVELCSLYLNSLELKTEAAPILRQLSIATGQTAFLATLQDDEVVYIDKVERFNSIRRYSIIGQRRPLYCTSLGKAFLMCMTNDKVKALFRGKKLVSRTANSITDLDTLLKHLAASRTKGWTYDNEEYEKGVRCIGAPIFDYRDHNIAAVSASWSAKTARNLKLPKVAAQVKKAAAEISRHMGSRRE